MKTQRNEVLFFWLLEQWNLEYGCPHLSQVPLLFCTSTCVKQLHVSSSLTLSIWWGCQSVACFPLKEGPWALSISENDNVCFSNATICMSSPCFYSFLQKCNLQKSSPTKTTLFLSLFSLFLLPHPYTPGSWSGLLAHQGAVIALSSPSRVSTEASCTQELCSSPAVSPGFHLTYIVDTPLTSSVTYQCCPGFLAWPWTLLVTWDFVGEDIAPACTVDILSSSFPSLGKLPALADPRQGCWKYFTYGWMICKEQGLINNFDLLNMDCHIHSYF